MFCKVHTRPKGKTLRDTSKANWKSGLPSVVIWW